jgi:hypothetical protein
MRTFNCLVEGKYWGVAGEMIYYDEKEYNMMMGISSGVMRGS